MSEGDSASLASHLVTTGSRQFSPSVLVLPLPPNQLSVPLQSTLTSLADRQGRKVQGGKFTILIQTQPTFPKPAQSRHHHGNASPHSGARCQWRQPQMCCEDSHCQGQGFPLQEQEWQERGGRKLSGFLGPLESILTVSHEAGHFGAAKSWYQRVMFCCH